VQNDEEQQLDNIEENILSIEEKLANLADSNHREFTRIKHGMRKIYRALSGQENGSMRVGMIGKVLLPPELLSKLFVIL
jgi:hypothetical protein